MPLFALMWSDVRIMVWNGCSPRQVQFWTFLIRQLLLHRGFCGVFFYRYGYWAFYRCTVPGWKQLNCAAYLLIVPLVRIVSGIEISHKADIGPGLMLLHSNQVIGEIKAGANLVLHDGVLCGQAKNVYPIFGDNVMLGARCIVIGDITLGNNVKVGAGTVVVKSVPDNCTVVGNPGRILEPKRIESA